MASVTSRAPLAPNDRAELRKRLVSLFNLEELETLAFDLGVDYNCLPHETTTQLSRELVDYFERRGNLYDLTIEALCKRDDKILKLLSIKLLPSFPRKKVQIILALGDQYNLEKLRNDIADTIGIDADEVEILGAALSSLRLLISLPQDAANVLVKSEIHELVYDGNQVISIADFDFLDAASQEAWRIIVRKGSRQQIRWKSVLESVSGRSLTGGSHEHRANLQIVGGEGDSETTTPMLHKAPAPITRLPSESESANILPLSPSPVEVPLGDALIMQRLAWPPTEPPLVFDAPLGVMADFLGVHQLSVQNRIYNVKAFVGDEPVHLRLRQNYWIVPIEGAQGGELALVREQGRPDQAGQFIAVGEPAQERVWIDKAESADSFTGIHSVGAERDWLIRDLSPDILDMNKPRLIGIVEAILVPV